MRKLTFMLLLLVGCGDPVVGETFSGTPSFAIGGPVVQANPRIPASHGIPSARLFWIGAEAGGAEQRATLDSALAEFSMTLFEPPPAGAGAFSELVSEGTLSIAVIALYADKNDDRLFDPEVDRLLGASAQHVLVYTSDGVTADAPAAALLGELRPGYHLYAHDQASVCRFVDAATCAGEGGLVPAAADAANVVLTLWASPEEVRVPAPALDPETSIWAMP